MDVTESVTRLCPTDICTSTAAAGDVDALVGDAVDVFGDRISLTGDAGDPVAGLVEDPVPDDPGDGVPGGDDDGFEGAYGGDRFELVKETIPFAHTKQTVRKLNGENWVEEEVEIVLAVISKLHQRLE